jgi:hypothetical protein
MVPGLSTEGRASIGNQLTDRGVLRENTTRHERPLVKSKMDPSADQEIRRFISALESLMDGDLAVEQLTGCGPRAIPYLRELLLHGRLRSIPQPRMRAVEALARLEAKAVLIEYLLTPKAIQEPQLRFAEDAVENTAARKLGRWLDEETYQSLLAVARRRLLPGTIETLGSYGRAESIPYLDRALEDDLCRPAAEEGFRRIGLGARRALVLSAITPLPSAQEEIASSVRRRRSALALLTEIGLEPESWSDLRLLLGEQDPEITARLAQLAVGVADRADSTAAAAHLVSVLPALPWFVREEAEHALVDLTPVSKPAVESEIARRSSRPLAQRAGDEILRMLLRVKAKSAKRI